MINEETLQQVPLFASLQPGEVAALAHHLSQIKLQPGTFLFHEGDVGECFYIILDGQLEVTKTLETPSGSTEERVLQTKTAGDFIGEMSMFAPQGLRTASVRALTPVKMLEMSHANLKELLHQQPLLAYEVVRELSVRLDISTNTIIRELREKNRQLAQAYAELQAAQAQIIEKERLERELQVARQIQQSILPHHLPSLEGYTFGALMTPARAVGGDLFDIIPLSDHTVGVVIGDVSDKGVPSAIFMALVRSLVRAEASRLAPPAEVLRRVNHHLLQMNDAGLFVTVVYGVVDGSRHEFAYARAGHEVPLVHTRDGEAIEPGFSRGMLLGLFEDIVLDEQTIAIPPGGTVMLYSDGATDAMNPQGECFGLERLQAAIRDGLHLEAQDMVDQVLATIQAFQAEAMQADDVTLVSIFSDSHA